MPSPMQCDCSPRNARLPAVPCGAAHPNFLEYFCQWTRASDGIANSKRRAPMQKVALLLAAAAALLATSVAAHETIAPGAKVTVVFDQELPNVPGKSMRTVLVEYEPGAGSPSHRHPDSAFIYARVLEGAIRSKVNDEPERAYQAGESWTEKPGDHHQVSHNASNKEPAKLLAIFVVDTS